MRVFETDDEDIVTDSGGEKIYESGIISGRFGTRPGILHVRKPLMEARINRAHRLAVRAIGSKLVEMSEEYAGRSDLVGHLEISRRSNCNASLSTTLAVTNEAALAY